MPCLAQAQLMADDSILLCLVKVPDNSLCALNVTNGHMLILRDTSR